MTSQDLPVAAASAVLPTESWLDPLTAVFVVANLLPILPVLLDAVQPLPKPQRRRRLLTALLAGNGAALLFAVVGGNLLTTIGTTVADMRVAGGLILLVFAVYDLLFSRERRKEPLGDMIEAHAEEEEDNGVGLVPLGIPLMVGPATLATVLLVSETAGAPTAILAVLVNTVLNAVLLVFAGALMDRVGSGLTRTVGKLFGLLLAAMAVSMIRLGIQAFGVGG